MGCIGQLVSRCPGKSMLLGYLGCRDGIRMTDTPECPGCRSVGPHGFDPSACTCGTDDPQRHYIQCRAWSFNADKRTEPEPPGSCVCGESLAPSEEVCAVWPECAASLDAANPESNPPIIESLGGVVLPDLGLLRPPISHGRGPESPLATAVPDHHVICPGCAYHFDATPQSAKDAIAGLKAERDAETRRADDNDALRRAAIVLHNEGVAYLARAIQAEAERDTLRAALEYIVKRGYTGASYVALRALKGESYDA